MSGSWQAERGSSRTRRHPRDDPRAEVGQDVRFGVGVGVRVGPVEFQLNGARAHSAHIAVWARASLFRRFTDTNEYGTGFVKIWKTSVF